MTSHEADSLQPGDWFISEQNDKFLVRHAAYFQDNALVCLARQWYPRGRHLGGLHRTPLAKMHRCPPPEGYVAAAAK